MYKLRNASRILYNSGEKIPVTFLCFLTAALAITAIPPFNGYASKAALSYTLKGSWQGIFLYAASLGTVASFIKLSRIFLPGREEKDAETTGKIKMPVLISQMILALLCVVSGIGAIPVSRLVIRLIGGVGKKGLPPDLFSTGNFSKTGIVVLGGILLYIVISTSAGKKILHIIRDRPKKFQGNFIALSLGMVFLFYWILL